LGLVGTGEASWATEGVGWVWVFILGWVLFYFFLLSISYFKHHSNLFEFKSNLNSNSYALKQLKLMHQHECNNEFNLEKF